MSPTEHPCRCERVCREAQACPGLHVPLCVWRMGEVSTATEQIPGGRVTWHPGLPCDNLNPATAGDGGARETAPHLGSAWRWSCCLMYQRKWCWGRKSGAHRARSCQHCGAQAAWGECWGRSDPAPTVLSYGAFSTLRTRAPAGGHRGQALTWTVSPKLTVHRHPRGAQTGQLC